MAAVIFGPVAKLEGAGEEISRSGSDDKEGAHLHLQNRHLHLQNYGGVAKLGHLLQCSSFGGSKGILRFSLLSYTKGMDM